MTKRRADDWDEDIPVVLGIGTATTITETKKVTRVKRKRPIGFDLKPKKKR